MEQSGSSCRPQDTNDDAAKKEIRSKRVIAKKNESRRRTNKRIEKAKPQNKRKRMRQL